MVRSDNDTWDLATSVGATATMVAAVRARATRARLIDDRFAEPLVAAVGIDFFHRWATGELDPAEVDIPGNPWGLQPQTDRLIARTPYIDDFIADACAAGIHQVVILASGLDTRGYRLSWPTGVTLFEIDQPQVIEFKQTTLAALGAEPTVDLRAVPIDLRHDWPAALRQAGFDTARPTVWIAEALVNFLTADAQDRLLDDITALSADVSRLMVEVLWNSPDSQQILQAATQRWYQHGLDIRLEDLGYFGQRHDIASYLSDHGWHSTRTSLRQLLIDNGLPAPTHAAGEGLDADYYCVATLHRAH
ncbi:class I SAM-dependent methyltransferase [Mycobacterium sp.]|uniref:class I SAM-dependent methyltransferase n=1 Tax=Mycobacterium sp. TaxID=1785 RepID=UPI003D6A5DE1